MSASPAAWRAGAGHVVLAVRLTPKGGRDSVEGVAALADGRAVLAVKVRAVPDKGAANRALTELIAQTLRVPKSTVSVVAGQTARLKQVRVNGNPDELIAKMKAQGWD